MKFKRPELQYEFHNRLHPEARAVCIELDQWSDQQDLPSVVITDILRTPERMRALYGDEKKFSWHLVACAVDIRNTHYSEDQLAKVVAWLEKRCTKGPWELVTKVHGTGPHIHLARRDFIWRSTCQPAKTPAVS